LEVTTRVGLGIYHVGLYLLKSYWRILTGFKSTKTVTIYE